MSSLRNFKNKKLGFILPLTLGLLIFTVGIIIIFTEVIAASYKIRSQLDEFECIDTCKTFLREVAWEYYSTQCSMASDYSHNKDILYHLLEKAFSNYVDVLDLELKEAQLFENHEIWRSNPIHPLASTHFDQYMSQDLKVTLKPKVSSKAYSFTIRAFLAQIPIEAIPMIVDGILDNQHFKSQINVEGLCLSKSLMNVPSMVRTKQSICRQYKDIDKSFSEHFFASSKFGFGIYPPLKTAFSTDQQYTTSNASSVNQPDSLTIAFDGMIIYPQISGISCQVFDRDIIRVIISPEALPNSYNKYIIRATTPQARQRGIVIKGTNAIYSPKSIITNATTWLHKSHTGSPLLISNLSGKWTFTDDSWTPQNNSNAALNLHMHACLISPPLLTSFESPQHGNQTKGSLKILGSLICGGQIQGNLESINILKSNEKLPQALRINLTIPYHISIL